MDDDDDDSVAPPPGVRLRDPNDTDGLRDDIEQGILKSMQKYVHGYEYGGTRLELSDLAYADRPKYSLAEQREALLKDSTLARRLRGTVSLVDVETNKPLEVRKNVTLARVPYLTQRGTMIHNGSEYAPVSQSRLLPGAYTRRRNNGELETHFNTRPGSGSAIRMSLDPTTGQYRLRVGTSNVHAYSVLKDMGVTDDEMERRWGPEILEANRKGYDQRAIDRVYAKAIPKWQRDASLPKADKARAVVEAFGRAQVARTVLRDNLPNLYSREKAASWRFLGLAMEKAAGVRYAEAAPEPEWVEDAPQALSLVDATRRILFKSASPVAFKPKPAATHHRYLSDDDEHEEYESIGVDGILAASEKLLAVNRGLERPDQRDTASNERVYTVDRLMAERIKLDHGKTLRTLMGRLSRRKNLSALGPAAFDAYTVDYLKGNPTASAIEEINPMNIMEQRRRITKMGPGGIGDPNAITVGMQSVDASQFGFISPAEGPESEKAGIDVRLSYGARIGSDGRIYQLMRNARTGKKQWVSPSDLKGKTVRLPD
jgi:DNA-directed RNA polymerase subunit beta